MYYSEKIGEFPPPACSFDLNLSDSSREEESLWLNSFAPPPKSAQELKQPPTPNEGQRMRKPRARRGKFVATHARSPEAPPACRRSHKIPSPKRAVPHWENWAIGEGSDQYLSGRGRTSESHATQKVSRRLSRIARFLFAPFFSFIGRIAPTHGKFDRTEFPRCLLPVPCAFLRQPIPPVKSSFPPSPVFLRFKSSPLFPRDAAVKACG